MFRGWKEDGDEWGIKCCGALCDVVRVGSLLGQKLFLCGSTSEGTLASVRPTMHMRRKRHKGCCAAHDVLPCTVGCLMFLCVVDAPRVGREGTARQRLRCSAGGVAVKLVSWEGSSGCLWAEAADTQSTLMPADTGWTLECKHEAEGMLNCRQCRSRGIVSGEGHSHLNCPVVDAEGL
jgi:hypothetical protein